MVRGVSYDITKRSMQDNLKAFTNFLRDIYEFISNIFNWKNEVGARKIEESNNRASNIAAYIASTIKDKEEGKITAYDYFGIEGLVSGFTGTKKNANPLHVSKVANIDNHKTNSIGSKTMVTAVDTISKFYLNKVATYQCKYKTADNTVSNHASTKKAYDYLNSNAVIGTSVGNKEWSVTLSDNDNIKQVPSVSRFAYKSNDLRKVVLVSERGPEIYADYAGDDCSGFASAVLRIANNGKRGQNGVLITNGYGTVKDIDVSSLMNKDSSNSKALFNLGYEMYINENGVWEKYYLTNGVLTNETENNMSINSLIPGDMLACNGSPDHIEFYVGNDYEVVYEDLLNNSTNRTLRNQQKKTYDWGNKFPKHNGVNRTTGNNENIRKEGTFAWGDVKDEYPSESSSGQRHYFYYDTTQNVFRHCECGYWKPLDERGHSSTCSIYPENEHYGREYTVIWRKR